MIPPLPIIHMSMWFSGTMTVKNLTSCDFEWHSVNATSARDKGRPPFFWQCHQCNQPRQPCLGPYLSRSPSRKHSKTNLPLLLKVPFHLFKCLLLLLDKHSLILSPCPLFTTILKKSAQICKPRPRVSFASSSSYLSSMGSGTREGEMVMGEEGGKGREEVEKAQALLAQLRDRTVRWVAFHYVFLWMLRFVLWTT